jgi:hypothetical protein
MTTTVKAGFVLGSDGDIYAQIPADNQWGFSICDDDQAWAGGVGSGLESWTLLPNEDSRITEDDRERIGWMLDEVDQESDYSVVPDVVFEYPYKTDSCQGIAIARDFDEAKHMLEGMLPNEAVADGAWGWSQDQDETRYYINKDAMP